MPKDPIQDRLDAILAELEALEEAMSEDLDDPHLTANKIRSINQELSEIADKLGPELLNRLSAPIEAEG